MSKDKPQQGKRVLVADDEEAIRKVLARHLERAGHTVATASDGQAALEAFEKTGFDAVITDLNMPRLGGVELVRRVKEQAPGTITIVLTGYATLDSAVEVLHQGCDDYLLKPLPDVRIVSHALERCLARRRAMALASSHRKVSQAKDNILSMAVEEFDSRLVDVQQSVAEVEAACTGGTPAEAAGAVGRLRAQLAQLRAVLADVRTASDTVRQRSSETPPE
jgi:DNA-binding NtrC family response regulator